VWEALRAHAGVRAFYEPLHEDLARLTQAGIGHFRPDSWGSLHGDGTPYFEEYRTLLRGRRGVALYRRRFAFDGFFLPPDSSDPALEAYVAQLLDLARAEGRVPVLKFCRSLGRVAWMRARFPDAVHAVLLRDPVAQWRSCRRQMEADGNRYFVLAPFLILARNAGDPLLRDAMRWLNVTPPALLGGGFGVAQTATWRHVQRLDWAQRYRGFLAVWAATSVAALASGAAMVDADRLDEPAQGDALGALLARAGLGFNARPRGDTGAQDAWPGEGPEARDAAAAALAALDFVREHRGVLPEGGTRALSRLLAPRFPLPGGVALTRAGLPTVHPVRPAPLLRRQADAAAYVALQAALYPLRRAHYYAWRALGWHDGPGVRRVVK